MRTRKSGYTDVKLMTISLGIWAISGPWQFGQQEARTRVLKPPPPQTHHSLMKIPKKLTGF